MIVDESVWLTGQTALRNLKVSLADTLSVLVYISLQLQWYNKALLNFSQAERRS